MRSFTDLYNKLDLAHHASDKIAALTVYFASVPQADAAWALFLLAGRKLPRALSPQTLRQWAADQSGLPLWLVEASYESVGDASEAVALLLPEPTTAKAAALPLHRWMTERLMPLRDAPDAEKRRLVGQEWDELACAERVIWNKLVTGTFRSPVSPGVVEQALAAQADVPQAVIAQRLASDWEPTEAAFCAIVAPSGDGDEQRESLPAGDDAAEATASAKSRHTLTAVLLYVQVERPNRPAEYTFGAWDGETGRLAPIAKLSDVPERDRRKLDRHARLHTTERFGPVRAVAPTLVVEIGFSGVNAAPRAKSGLAIAAPQLLQVRDDATPDRADTLETLRAMIADGER